MITSSQNPRIKQIRALAQRKRREETGRYFTEGIRLVGEALQTNAQIETLVVAPALLRSAFAQGLAKKAEAESIDVLHVSPAVFRSISIKDGPQGIGAVVCQQWILLDEVIPDEASGWVILEDVGSPGNLGAILRTGDAVGTAGVMLLGDTADPYDPKTIRGSMGAVFSQKITRTSVEALQQWKKTQKLELIGACGAATTDYRSANYRLPALLCLGSEQHGMSCQLQKICDRTVRIPMGGRVDSLNLAVAAGVLMYEVFSPK